MNLGCLILRHLVWAVCFSSWTLFTTVDAASDIVDTCYLSSYIIHVKFDSETKSFMKVEQDPTGHKRRNLRGVSSRTLESDSPIFQAKWCECATHSRGADRNDYCILTRNENVCQVPIDKDEPILCSRLSHITFFTKNAWPISLLWLGAMLIYVIFTEGGQQVGRYILIKTLFCWSPHIWNSNLVEESLRNESLQRTRGHHILDRSAERVSATVYVLKTQEYSPLKTKKLSENISPSSGITAKMTPDSADDSHSDFCSEIENEEVVCTICIGDIEEGDMIGALPCQHRFHVECLKQWLRRKNVCPLCQGPIADVKSSPHVIENHGTTESRYTALARILRIRRERRMRNRQSIIGISSINSNRSIQVGDPAASATRHTALNVPIDIQRRAVVSGRNRTSNRELLERRRQYLNDIRRQLNH